MARAARIWAAEIIGKSNLVDASDRHFSIPILQLQLPEIDIDVSNIKKRDAADERCCRHGFAIASARKRWESSEMS